MLILESECASCNMFSQFLWVEGDLKILVLHTLLQVAAQFEKLPPYMMKSVSLYKM